MAFKFPFTNYHELNLTWVLEQLKKLFEDSEENVETIEGYEDRLSAVETELPVVEATAEQAATVANAAASLAQTAKSTADTANENALTASAQAGLARQEAAAAEAEAQAATQAAQQAQAAVQNFDGRITQAENDASEALQEAQSFENRVDAAINTANNAANTATIAQGIAVNANQNAATALDTAQAADTKAEAAQDAAEVAYGKAEAAQDAADIADGKAEAAQDTADQNAAKIGNLSDLTTTAKNNLVAAINEAAQSGGSGDNTNCAPIIINTASGDIAAFDDGADNRKIRKIVGTIVPKQAAGTPSPETPLSISGWTEAHISQSPYTQTEKHTITGKNLYNAPNNALTLLVPCHIENGVSVVVSAKNGGNSGVRYYNASKTRIDYWTLSQYDTRTGRSYKNFTATGGIEYVEVYGGNATDIMVETNVTVPSDYEPYGRGIPVNWQTEAGTVYGGSLTLNEDGSVDLYDTYEKHPISWGTFSWRFFEQNSDGDGYVASTAEINTSYQPSDQIFSEIFKEHTLTTAQGVASLKLYEISMKQFRISICTPYNNATDLITNLGNIDIIYKSNKNVHYHIPNIGSLFTYLGTNNIWIYTGAITECNYPADTKLYIDGKIAELQALILEN